MSFSVTVSLPHVYLELLFPTYLLCLSHSIFFYIPSSFPFLGSPILEGAIVGQLQEFTKSKLLLFHTYLGHFCYWIGQQLPLLFLSVVIKLACHAFHWIPASLLFWASPVVWCIIHLVDCFSFLHWCIWTLGFVAIGLFSSTWGLGKYLVSWFCFKLPLGFSYLSRFLYYLWDSAF